MLVKIKILDSDMKDKNKTNKIIPVKIISKYEAKKIVVVQFSKMGFRSRYDFALNGDVQVVSELRNDHFRVMRYN